MDTRHSKRQMRYYALGETSAGRATVDAFDRITVEPGRCGGKPCIRDAAATVDDERYSIDRVA